MASKATLALKAGLWFRRGRLVMVSPVAAKYAAIRQKFHLSRLSSFSEPPLNGLYKAEVIHRRGPWRSFEAVEFATLEWVDWFNNRRLLEPIGNIPPAEAEERYYAMLEEQAIAA